MENEPRKPLILSAYDSYAQYCKRIGVPVMDIQDWSKCNSGWGVTQRGVDAQERRNRPGVRWDS